MQGLKAGYRKIVALTVAVTALATGVFWYQSEYPSTVVGSYIGSISSTTDSEVELTLRPGGNGYLKMWTDSERAITWKADGDRIVIQSTEMLIARRVSNQELDLDLGMMVPLMRK